MAEDKLYPTPDEYDDHTMKDSPTYTPPKVWQWNQDEENRFSKINRPIAGPTHDKDLPVGEHPLQLYSLATPNGVKVTVPKAKDKVGGKLISPKPNRFKYEIVYGIDMSRSKRTETKFLDCSKPTRKRVGP